jgi:hypothetical protein
MIRKYINLTYPNADSKKVEQFIDENANGIFNAVVTRYGVNYSYKNVADMTEVAINTADIQFD